MNKNQINFFSLYPNTNKTNNNQQKNILPFKLHKKGNKTNIVIRNSFQKDYIKKLCMNRIYSMATSENNEGK
jgi:hypothetical protein